MVVPTVFRQASDIQVNYDGIDISTGKAWKSFTGLIAQGSVVSNAILITSTSFDSDMWRSRGSYVGASLVLALEVNFDIKFERTFQIEGRIFTNCTVEGVPDGAQSGSGTLTVKFFHVDAAAAETQLGSTVTTASFDFTNTVFARRFCIEQNLDKRLFKRGETLRVSYELRGKGGGGGDSGIMSLYHDPTNRNRSDGGDTIVDHTDFDTTLLVDVPFVVAG